MAKGDPEVQNSRDKINKSWGCTVMENTVNNTALTLLGDTYVGDHFIFFFLI